MNDSKATFTRRGILGFAGTAVLGTVLTACFPAGQATGSGGASSVAGPLKFWDLPWGTAAYADASTSLVAGFTPKTAAVTALQYQNVPWANYYQTFASAVASNSGPAVSTGGAFQGFQFAEQGFVAGADNLVAKLKASGAYADFLPNTVDAMKGKDGYVAVPFNIDVRALHYRESLLEKAGVDVPTDWDSLRAAASGLKAIGVVGFGLAVGTTTAGAQVMLAMMHNNAGGFFTENGELDVMNDRNLETVEFLLAMAKDGLIDQAAISYSQDNLYSDWTSGRIGMGFGPAGLTARFADDQKPDVKVSMPLVGPHGDFGTFGAVNPLIMYTNTPSQEGSEEFLEWYLDNMSALWDAGIMNSIPARRSILELPSMAKNSSNMVAVANNWQQYARSFAGASKIANGGLAAIDGGQAMTTFGQQVVQAKESAKSILQSLNDGIAAVI